MTNPPPADPGHDRPEPPPPRVPLKRRGFGLKALLAVGIVSALAAVGIALLLTNIVEHKQEAQNPFYRVVALDDTTQDPAVWGKNFPLQYDDYRKTVDQQRTRYGGSEAIPHTPSDADPRSIVAQSRLEEDPRLRQLWAGYAFAGDFREERGHAYVLLDQEFTERQRITKQPGTCLHCHASVYVPYRRAGNGDLVKGFEAMNQLPYAEARKLVTHPVACIDCHSPDNMQLRVTRPGFMEGIRALKASQGVADYDVNRDATRQEMRTYVCGQCHVEYYFKGPEKRLTYPWARGLTADSILSYYDSTGHKDWTHATSGAPVLKAQHPEFELYNQGVHARAGVACSDCHMPYKRAGAMKISDHHVRSPLLNINRACQTCHKFTEEELRQRVYQIQDRTFELRNVALDATLALTSDIAAAVGGDSTDARINVARQHQRYAQFLLDFVEAENSMGFHAPQEAARLLTHSVDQARRGQMVLRGTRGLVASTPGTKAPLPGVVSSRARPSPEPRGSTSTDATQQPKP
jgi:nitrite reductase (cytochrome c-552)